MHAPGKILALAALCFSAPAFAQNTPKHEFGIDLVIASVKPTMEDVPSSALPRALAIATPFDVRIGFLTQSRMMLEARFGFSYLSLSESDVNEDASSLEFTPGVNLLFRLGSGSGLHRQMGPYITVGGGVEIARETVDGETTSSNQLTANIGIGTRKSMGSIAFRPEAFFAKLFETDDEAGANIIGVRLGLSFFK